VLNKAPFLKHYLVLTQYTPERSTPGGSGAAIAQFVESTTIVALVKKPEQVMAVEDKLRDLRNQLLVILEGTLSSKQARLELQVYIDLILRCLLNKPWPEHLKAIMSKVPIGKFSSEKILDLGVVWAKYIDDKNPMMNFAIASGLVGEVLEEEDSQNVELRPLRVLRARVSDEKPSGSGDVTISFKLHDEVTVWKRMTWVVPVEGKTTGFRKDPKTIKKIMFCLNKTQHSVEPENNKTLCF
jgi:hypothetical protein